MNADNHSHEDISLLLPWYMNGTLDGDESGAVKRHLSECALCAREVEELTFISSVIAESNEALAGTMDMRLEAMELNIMDRIDELEDSRVADTRREAGRERASVWAKALEFFEGFKLSSPIPAGLAALFLLQLALIIGLASKLYLGEPEGYVVLSGPGETAGAGGPVIILSFVDTATEAEIRETLNGIGGRIIDGPKAGGLYVVELAGEPGPAQLDEVIENLKSEKDIIKNVFKGQGK